MKNDNSSKLEINWHHLKDGTHLLLKGDCIKILIKRGVEKYGSINKLSKITGLTYPSLYYAASGRIGMISVMKLRTLAKHLDIDFDYFNKKILEIRKGAIPSIKNPRFPIKLSTPEAGAVLGFVCSDGWIHIDKKARMSKRTLYSSDDIESIDAFKKNINKIFGSVHFQEEVISGHIRIRIGSSAIGESLEKAGGIVGNKTKINADIPWAVKKGSIEMKREYLRAVFSDEGSIGRLHAPFVTLTRYNKISLSRKQKIILDEIIEKHMHVYRFPTGHIHKKIGFGKVKDIINNSDIKCKGRLLRLFGKSTSKLLSGESEILKEIFGIENHLYITSLNKTGSGYYTLSCSMIIRRKADVIKFYKEIGFILPRKQKKLECILMERGFIPINKGGQHGIKIV